MVRSRGPSLLWKTELTVRKKRFRTTSRKCCPLINTYSEEWNLSMRYLKVAREKFCAKNWESWTTKNLNDKKDTFDLKRTDFSGSFWKLVMYNKIVIFLLKHYNITTNLNCDDRFPCCSKAIHLIKSIGFAANGSRIIIMLNQSNILLQPHNSMCRVSEEFVSFFIYLTSKYCHTRNIKNPGIFVTILVLFNEQRCNNILTLLFLSDTFAGFS